METIVFAIKQKCKSCDLDSFVPVQVEVEPIEGGFNFTVRSESDIQAFDNFGGAIALSSVAFNATDTATLDKISQPEKAPSEAYVPEV